MFRLLDAQTDRLVHHAQTLFRLPELGWLESIQSEVEQGNPVLKLESVLSDILARQYPEQDFTYPVTAESLTPSYSTIPDFSQKRSSKTSTDVSRFTADRGHGSAPVKKRAAEVLPLQAQDISSLMETRAGIADPFAVHSGLVLSEAPQHERNVNQRNIYQHDVRQNYAASAPSIGSTQSTRLLTEVDDLQNLLRALPREASRGVSSKESSLSRLDMGAVPGTNMARKAAELMGKLDDLSAIERHASLLDGDLENSIDQQHRSPASMSNINNRNMLASQQGKHEKLDARTSRHTVPVAPHHPDNSKITSAAFHAPPTGTAPMQLSLPKSNSSDTDSSPLFQGQPEHTEAGARSILDNATLELLLEELLDRLEERQREDALRTLGFTGGRI